VRNALVTVASNYGRFVVGIASVAVVTPAAIDAIGFDRFGLWALAAAACGFIALFELGIATTSMRYAAEAEGAGNPELRNSRLSTLLVAQWPLAAIMLVVGWFAAAPIAHALGLDPQAAADFATIVRVGATATALALPAALWRAALAANGDLPLVNLIDAAAIAAGALVTLTGLQLGSGVLALAAGAATTTLAPALVLLFSARRRVPQLRVSWQLASIAEWRSMRNFAGAAVTTNTANLAAQRLEPAVVNAFLPLAAVGQYSVAARVAEYALLLGRQLSSALTPLIAKAHGAGDVGAIRTSLVMGTRFQAALMLPFALLLAWHAPALLGAWLGPEGTSAAAPLRLLCCSLALASLAMHPAICLGMTGQHRLVAQAALGGALLRLVAGAMLVGTLGLAGIGMAAIVACAVVDVGLVVTRACRHAGVPLRAFARDAIAPSLPALLATTVTAQLLGRWHTPVTLPEIAVQAVIAGVVFVLTFLPFGLRGLQLRRSRAGLEPLPGALPR
jgi:O-antigen/teichoic acid export membrane protein